ncbi:hypothetical protein HAALTHF_50780n [Vreelandella aquamarina]|nr:hypothetical protein HAALTHF_50780n [Halomonas axialensis]
MVDAIGAVLLATTDLLLQQFGGMVAAFIPTGAITGALGAPLLMWLIPRLKLQATNRQKGRECSPIVTRRLPAWPLVCSSRY